MDDGPEREVSRPDVPDWDVSGRDALNRDTPVPLEPVPGARQPARPLARRRERQIPRQIDVARLARVSPAVVSRVLNSRPGSPDSTVRLSEATRQRVLAAINELGYKPNVLAQGLRTRRSGGVGVVVKSLHTSFNGRLLSGVESVMEAAGMHLMVSSGRGRAETEAEAIAFLLERRCDALILSPSATDDAALSDLGRGEVPVIVVGHAVAGLEERCVALADAQGGRLATEHLLGAGLERVAHIAGPPGNRAARARLEGYRSALERRGLAYDPRLVLEGDYSKRSGYEAARALLARGFVNQGAGGIFVANDRMAEGALERLAECGVRVPHKVSVVGYDNTLVAPYLRPALTTVRQPIFEVGVAAAQLALAALGAHEGEVTRWFEPQLVVRDSVAALRA